MKNVVLALRDNVLKKLDILVAVVLSHVVEGGAMRALEERSKENAREWPWF